MPRVRASVMFRKHERLSWFRIVDNSKPLYKCWIFLCAYTCLQVMPFSTSKNMIFVITVIWRSLFHIKELNKLASSPMQSINNRVMSLLIYLCFELVTLNSFSKAKARFNNTYTTKGNVFSVPQWTISKNSLKIGCLNHIHSSPQNFWLLLRTMSTAVS